MDTKEKELQQPIIRVASQDTDASTLYSHCAESSNFKPGKTLVINARGIGAFPIPLPSRQLEIEVTDLEGNNLYTSTRASVLSGDAVLSNGSGDLVATKYFFGPNRDPVMHLVVPGKTASVQDDGGKAAEAGLGEEIKTKSSWTSRTHHFAMPDGRQFEWRYVREKTTGLGKDAKKSKKETKLVLQSLNGKDSGRAIAQLVRNEVTRTEGSKACTSGNGGHLVLDAEVGATLERHVVVATCLLMLKKEIDRRMQLMMFAVAGGAG